MPRHASSWQPPAWQLLGALCQPYSSSPHALAAAAWQGQITDWRYFLELAAHHRLRPLVLKGASRLGVCLPDAIQAVLREEALLNAREAFRYLAELQRVLALLAAAGVFATVLKGVPLSFAAYGDVSVREVGDIDLLIDPADSEVADAVLRQSGLTRKEPAALLTPRRMAFYQKYFKDYTYEPEQTGSGFEIDLHWRLVRDADMAQRVLPITPANGGRELLRIGSLELNVLSRERCLLYLAVHGATEGWARRKSLVDIAALWAGFQEEERHSLRATADAEGCADFLDSALQLVEEWMGLPAGVTVAHGGREVRPGLRGYIVHHAGRRMLKGQGLPLPGGESAVAMKWHEARLYPTLPSRKALAMRVLFRPRIWETVELPDALFFLYPVFSPFEWLAFRLKRWLRTNPKTSASEGEQR